MRSLLLLRSLDHHLIIRAVADDVRTRLLISSVFSHRNSLNDEIRKDCPDDPKSGFPAQYFLTIID
jgi:hypothetical protein